MKMNTRLIEIQVHGFTGDGKSHVCETIKRALIAEYGAHTQVASRTIAQEKMLGDIDNRPTSKVIFSVEEYNHGAMGTHDV